MTSDTAARRPRRAVVVAVTAVLALALGGIAVAQVPFTDIDGNTHEDNIRHAYELGITVGTTPTTYSPRASVRRDQMASFLINTLEHAHPQIEIEWLLETVSEAFVLPDGTTFTDDDVESLQEDEELPPVGSQIYFTEDMWSVDDDGDPDEVIGSTHVDCVHQVEPGRFNCGGVFEIDGQGNLFLSASLNFLDAEEDDDFSIDLAVTGGTGAFHGATGELTLEDFGDELELVSGTVLVHGTR